VVDPQLRAAFEAESRSVLELRARLAPRRQSEARELKRLAQQTARLRAGVAQLRRERAALQRRHEAGTRQLAVEAMRAWWSWTRLGRPLAVAGLVILFLVSIPFAVLEAAHLLAVSGLAFGIGAWHATPPRRPGAGG
jgi:hypothetical protein